MPARYLPSMALGIGSGVARSETRRSPCWHRC